jgi:hypothetical protein
MKANELWRYREATWTTSALEGFNVEATDGSIGKIDEASYDVGAGYVVVDTGPWIFGKKVMLPAGVIRDVDFDTETVYVDRSKDQIKNAPEFDENRYRNKTYRNQYKRDLNQGVARAKAEAERAREQAQFETTAGATMRPDAAGEL